MRIVQFRKVPPPPIICDLGGLRYAIQFDESLSIPSGIKYVSNTPTILLNPNLLKQFSPITQQFMCGHELGHLVRRHRLGTCSAEYEDDADYYGLVHVFERGFLNDSNVSTLVHEVATFPPSDAATSCYYTGPERARRLWCRYLRLTGRC